MEREEFFALKVGDHVLSRTGREFEVVDIYERPDRKVRDRMKRWVTLGRKWRMKPVLREAPDESDPEHYVWWKAKR
jgi:hypothetical protein